MGGWRCTYRNCSMAADGKTHLFHYPVFDKVRCLKWLSNAGRLEFLNLKLSQLKNRVICQHHFKDECFMNYKKDRLTFEAVPTKNGSVNDSMVQIDENNCLITLEQMAQFETRPLSKREKRANFSMKYADFITDPIIYSADNIPETNCEINPLGNEKVDEFINLQTIPHKTLAESSGTTSYSVSQPLCNSRIIDSKGISFLVELVPTPNVYNMLETTPNYVYDSIKQQSDFTTVSSQINPSDNTDALFNNSNIPSCPETNNTMGNNNNKIKIISERTLSMPVPVAGKFEPVCPMGILNPRKRKVETEQTNKENSLKSIVKEEPQLPKLKKSKDPVEHKSQTKPNLSEHKNNSKTPNKIENGDIVSSKSPNTRIKVPPERIAAIEEKRLFNKKLRDMIQFCLDEKEDNTKTHDNTKPTTITENEKQSEKLPEIKNKPLYNQSEKSSTKSPIENVKKQLRKQELENTVNEKEGINSSGSTTVLPDYKLSALEAKLSRMESLLLKKVGENTQRIDNLKQTLCKSNDVKKRSIQTQTMQSTEFHKKQLFHEISKYLSPDLNSLIYEELFMKEFKPITSYKNASNVGVSPTKRQRRR